MLTIPPCAHENKKIARNLARLAVRSLYFEVKAYPKPGLVSFVDRGAHVDMDGTTFYRSLFSLRHYFYRITLQGLSNAGFEELKTTAIHAEKKMLMTTLGINTHRGAIFSLGLFCVSSARLRRKKPGFFPLDLQEQLKKDWRVELEKHTRLPNSHGNIAAKNQRVVGAKEMAMQGYKVVFQLLKSFMALFKQTTSIDTSCLYAYLYFLLNIDDTNVLYRTGMEGMLYARSQAEKVLIEPCLQTREKMAILLHRLFSKQNISPGGVGDLLAVLLFVAQLFDEQLLCHY